MSCNVMHCKVWVFSIEYEYDESARSTPQQHLYRHRHNETHSGQSLLGLTVVSPSDVELDRAVCSGYSGIVLRYAFGGEYVRPGCSLPSPMCRACTGSLSFYSEDTLAHELVCCSLPEVVAFMFRCCVVV